MMTSQLLLALLAFAFVSSITPGPNNLMLMASGANFGLKRTIPHMLGISLGFVFMLALVGIGLAQVFERIPATFLALKILSSIYLLYLAWKIANAAPLQDNSNAASSNSKPFTFLQAALFQWVNPKAWSMGTTAIATYSLQDSPLLSVFIICSVFLVVNFPAVTTWAVAGTRIKHFLNTPAKTRIFNVTAAILLAMTLYPAWIGH
nr:LysE family translocator [Hirschia maritima]